MFKEKLKTISRILGYVITAVSFYYIGRLFWTSDFGSLQLPNLMTGTIWLILLTLVHTFVLVVDAYTWQLILESIKGQKIRFWDVFDVHAKSGIAKYLPGNVFHLVARNFLGNKLGWKHADITFSSFLEMVIGLSFVAFLLLAFYFLKMLQLPADFPFKINTDKIVLTGLVFGLILLAGLFFYKRKKFLEIFSWHFFRKTTSLTLRIYFLKFFFNILLGGMIFVALFYFVLGADVHWHQVMPMIAVMTFSYFAGFITPGAPGGLGVRESLIVLLLAGEFSQSSVLIASLLLRLVTVAADFLLYLIAFSFKQKQAD